MPKAKLAVVLACYNRRETTLKCLAALYAQKRETWDVSVTLLDDASSDGTAEAVKGRFTDVEVITGDGNRFWGGGMFDAIQAATKRPFDYLLWLNDDVALEPDAIERLLACSARVDTEQGSPLNVVCGAMRDDATGDLSYGGFERTNRWNPAKVRHIRPAESEPKRCDTINGNLVLIPGAVMVPVGNLDPVFRHTLGDIDFGYRVRRSGGLLWMAPGFLGHCATNPGTTPWTNPAISMSARLSSLTSPRGLPLDAWSTFMWRWGKITGLILMVGMYMKALTTAVLAKSANAGPPTLADAKAVDPAVREPL